MKFVAEVSSSSSSPVAPASSASMMLAAWLVLPLASSLEKQRVLGVSPLRSSGKRVDEGVDVDALDAASVLGADLHEARVCDHPLAAIAWDVGMDRSLQRLQQRGFAVIAPADDQGDAARDSHSGNLGFRRRSSDRRLGSRIVDPQRLGRLERHRAFARERSIAGAALTRGGSTRWRRTPPTPVARAACGCAPGFRHTPRSVGPLVGSRPQQSAATSGRPARLREPRA